MRGKPFGQGLRVLFAFPRYHTNLFPLIEDLCHRGCQCEFITCSQSQSERHGRCEISVSVSTLCPRDWSAVFKFPSLRLLWKKMAGRKYDVICVKEGLSLYSLIVLLLGRVFQFRAVTLVETQHPQKYAEASLRILRLCGARRYVTPLPFSQRGRFKRVGVGIAYLPFSVYAHFGSRALDRPKDVLKIVSVGKFTRRKNHHLTVRVLDELRKNGLNAELTIVGEVACAEHKAQWEGLKCLIKELGHDQYITLIANVPPPRMFDIYQRNEVFVLLSECEPAAVSHLEAMACGLVPIVTTENGTGRYCPEECVIDHGDSESVLVENVWRRIWSLSSDAMNALREECRRRVLLVHSPQESGRRFLSLVYSEEARR